MTARKNCLRRRERSRRNLIEDMATTPIGMAQSARRRLGAA
jgi:hypothetical protein